MNRKDWLQLANSKDLTELLTLLCSNVGLFVKEAIHD